MKILLVSAAVLVAGGLLATTLSADNEPIVVTVTTADSYQGKSADWWAAHAVKARQDANARGARLRRLQTVVLGHRSSPAISGPLARSLLCIHRYEGSWSDPSAPFWGGLQMDMGFQRAYGGEFLRAWGTADHWPPFVQLAVGMRAVLAGRGFGPWPNTSRMCGLR
jgi:hypothetical protein